jgi:hypothetical protein
MVSVGLTRYLPPINLKRELLLLLLTLQQIQQVMMGLMRQHDIHLNVAYFSDASMSGSATSHANFLNCLGIYYQNVRGLRTNQPEFYDNVSASNFDIICLSETWLNDLCYDHNLFPSRYTVNWSDRPYINKARGGGVLTASLGPCSRRYDLEL